MERGKYIALILKSFEIPSQEGYVLVTHTSDDMEVTILIFYVC